MTVSSGGWLNDRLQNWYRKSVRQRRLFRGFVIKTLLARIKGFRGTKGRKTRVYYHPMSLFDWVVQEVDPKNQQAWAQFCSLVQGQSFLVWGPSGLGDQPADHEWATRKLVLTHYRPQQPLLPQTPFLSFYNQGFCEDNPEVLWQAQAQGVWCVVIDTKVTRALDLDRGKLLLVPMTVSFNKSLLMGLQRVLVCLVAAQADSIKLFNFDFYLGDKAYDAKYVNQRAGVALENALKHDLVFNYFFTRQLFRHGKFEASPLVSSFLKEPLGRYSRTVAKKILEGDTQK